MRVVASITQRSFARFVAFDLAEAARRLGWAVHWIDFDALTQQLAGSPREAWLATLARVTDEVRAFAPDLVLSYGIEAILPPFPDVLPDDPWRLADAARAPVACFFYDFGPPFDRPVDATTAPYVERLQRPDIRVFCWDRHAVADLVAVRRGRRVPADGGQRRDVPSRRLRRPRATCRSCSPAGRLPSASPRCAASRRQACRCTATTNRAGPPTRCSRAAIAASCRSATVCARSTSARRSR